MSEKKQFDPRQHLQHADRRIGLSLVCSIMVAERGHRPETGTGAERGAFRQQIILDVAGLYEPGADIGQLFRRSSARPGDRDIVASTRDSTGACRDAADREGADVANRRGPGWRRSTS